MDMLHIKECDDSLVVVGARLEQAAQAHKFGVINIVDLKAKMASKGVEFGPECRIYEVRCPLGTDRNGTTLRGSGTPLATSIIALLGPDFGRDGQRSYEKACQEVRYDGHRFPPFHRVLLLSALFMDLLLIRCKLVSVVGVLLSTERTP